MIEVIQILYNTVSLLTLYIKKYVKFCLYWNSMFIYQKIFDKATSVVLNVTELFVSLFSIFFPYVGIGKINVFTDVNFNILT